jgi:hypothetical protein
MNKIAIIFLQFMILIIGILSLFILIRFPMLEGRAVNLNLYEIYADPFIIYGYLSSIFYFKGLYQGLLLLRQISNDNLFSVSSVQTVKKIKYCSYYLGFLIIIGAIYIRFFNNSDEDPAGFLALSMITTMIFTTVATTALIFERSIQKAVKLKSDNELTI